MIFLNPLVQVYLCWLVVWSEYCVPGVGYVVDVDIIWDVGIFCKDMFDCDFHSSIIGLSSLAKVVAFNTVVFVSSNAVFVVSLSAFSFPSTLLGSGTQINVMFVPDTHSLIVLYLFCYVCCVFLAFQYARESVRTILFLWIFPDSLMCSIVLRIAVASVI